MNGAARGQAYPAWHGRWGTGGQDGGFTRPGLLAEGMTMMNPISMSLPVRNLAVSRAFFAELGFRFSRGPADADSACLVLGDGVRVLLVAEDCFRDRINGDSSHGTCAGDVLISVPASSEQEVDEIVMRAIVAGAKPWPVIDERPVYSGSFQDPDGHLWQVTCLREPSSQENAGVDSRAAA